jgi:cytochrome c-type biogenesis protein CcmH
MTTRRAFVARIASGSAALVVGSRLASAQQRGVVHDSAVGRDTTNLFAMDQMAAMPVKLPPKPGATPSMTPLERDALERRIHCQCGCTLDVFTCRTTDFSCQVSPSMHRDVMALVEGGYGAQEIIDAFVHTYGERALMAPAKSGFNLLAWVTPGAALITGAVVLTYMLRRLGRKPVAATPALLPTGSTSATPDELARLEAAVRGEDNA